MANRTTDPMYRSTLMAAVDAIEIIMPAHFEAARGLAENPGDQV
jgi:hypothetical protein